MTSWINSNLITGDQGIYHEASILPFVENLQSQTCPWWPVNVNLTCIWHLSEYAKIMNEKFWIKNYTAKIVYKGSEHESIHMTVLLSGELQSFFTVFYQPWICGNECFWVKCGNQLLRRTLTKSHKTLLDKFVKTIETYELIEYIYEHLSRVLWHFSNFFLVIDLHLQPKKNSFPQIEDDKML